jgi:hypothetical protein
VFNFFKFSENSKENLIQTILNSVFENLNKSEIFEEKLKLSAEELEELYLKARKRILDEFIKLADESKNKIKNQLSDICINNKIDCEETAKEMLYFTDKELVNFAKHYKDQIKQFQAINKIKKEFQNKVKNASTQNAMEKYLFAQPIPDIWVKKIPPTMLKNKIIFDQINQLKERLKNFQAKFPQIDQWTIKQALGWTFEYTPSFWKNTKLDDPDFKNTLEDKIRTEFENKPDKFFQSLGLAMSEKANDEFSKMISFVKENKNFKNIDEFKHYILKILHKIHEESDRDKIVPETILELDEKINEKLKEYSLLLDSEYNNLFVFSSKSEKEMIEVMRRCGLHCVPSRMTLPKPADFTGVKNNFIIDFMMYCPVLSGTEGNYKVEPKIILIGEYYGLYKPLNDEKRKQILEEINVLQKNLTPENAQKLRKLEKQESMGGAYNVKTDAKIASEKFIAASIGADTISIFPGPPETMVRKALDEANVIYELDGVPGNAKKIILSRPDLLKQSESINKGINKLTTYLEAVKTEVKSHYFNYFISRFRSDYTLENLGVFDNKSTTSGEMPLSARKIRTNILETIGVVPSPINVTANFSNLIERYLKQTNEGYEPRMKQLDDLIAQNEKLSLESVKNYVDNYILKFNKQIQPYSSVKTSFNLQGSTKQNMNNLKMDKIKILNCLVRLSQIAEEIEDTNPEAANLIDESVQEHAQEFNPLNYPAVNTPVAEINSSIDEKPGMDQLNDTVQEIEDTSEDDSEIIEKITKEVIDEIDHSGIDTESSDGKRIIEDLVKMKVDQALETKI